MKILLILLVVLLLPLSAHAITPSIVQGSGQIVSSDTDSVTLTGVAAGATLVLVAKQNAAAARTYSVADDTNGSWTNFLQQPDVAGTRFAMLGYYLDSAGGDIEVTVTISGATGFQWEVIELANADEVDVALNGEAIDATNSPAFFNPAVNFSADSIAIGIVQSNGSTAYSYTAGTANWSERWETLNGAMYTCISSAAETSESGTLTGTNTRNHTLAAVVFKSSGGGDPPASIVPILQHHKKRQGR